MMIVDGWLMIILDGFANPLGEATGSDSNGDTGGFNGTIIGKYGKKHMKILKHDENYIQ